MDTLTQLRTWKDRNGQPDMGETPVTTNPGGGPRPTPKPSPGYQLPDNRTAAERIIALGHDDSRGPSEKQTALIEKLMGDLAKVDPDGHTLAVVWYTDNAAKLTGGRDGTASAWIARLLGRIRGIRSGEIVVSIPDAPAPVETKKYDAYEDVTDGNYAYKTDGKTHFYRITRKEGKGQYAGRIFINVQQRVSDELIPVRGWIQKSCVLNAVRAAGPEASHLMYSARLSRCWHCNISLTDDRDNPYHKHGLGPVCGPKVMG